jgi:hypothetical protein
MMLDLTDEETDALARLLSRTIDKDRYPLSPRIQNLKGILAKILGYVRLAKDDGAGGLEMLHDERIVIRLPAVEFWIAPRAPELAYVIEAGMYHVPSQTSWRTAGRFSGLPHARNPQGPAPRRGCTRR